MLTERIIKAAKVDAGGKQVRLHDTGHPLRLVVSSAGKKSFAVTIVVENGKRTTRVIGQWPEMTLAEARLRCAELQLSSNEIQKREFAYERVAVAPELKATRDEQALSGSSLTNDVWDEYNRKTQSRVKPATFDDRSRAWKTYFMNGIGKERLRNIDRAAIRSVFDHITDEGARGKAAPIAANNALAYVKAFLSWCVERDYLEYNPAREIKKNPKVVRKVDLSDAQLRILLETRKAATWCENTFMLTLLTMCRPGEIMKLTWGDVDFETNEIMIDDPKNGEDHRVHLTPLMRKFLPERNGAKHHEKIFPQPEAKNAYLNAHITWRKATVKLARERDIKFLETWQLRDFRGTGATNISKQRDDKKRRIWGPEVVSRLLNHAETKVTTQHYDMYRSWEERQEALEFWSKHIEKLMN